MKPSERAEREAEVRGEWGVPEGVVIAREADLTRADPASEDGVTRRRCIAQTRAGKRCPTVARRDEVLCTAHAGKLDSSAGGRAKAEKSLAVKEEARERLVIAEMGARAVIRQTIIERAEDLRQTVSGLTRDAAAGDRRAQALLVQYLDQGFGKATVQAGETTPPDDTAGLHALTDDELRALAFASPTPSE